MKETTAWWGSRLKNQDTSTTIEQHDWNRHSVSQTQQPYLRTQDDCHRWGLAESSFDEKSFTIIFHVECRIYYYFCTVLIEHRLQLFLDSIVCHCAVMDTSRCIDSAHSNLAIWSKNKNTTDLSALVFLLTQQLKVDESATFPSCRPCRWLAGTQWSRLDWVFLRVVRRIPVIR